MNSKDPIVIVLIDAKDRMSPRVMTMDGTPISDLTGIFVGAGVGAPNTFPVAFTLESPSYPRQYPDRAVVIGRADYKVPLEVVRAMARQHGYRLRKDKRAVVGFDPAGASEFQPSVSEVAASGPERKLVSIGLVSTPMHPDWIVGALPDPEPEDEKIRGAEFDQVWVDEASNIELCEHHFVHGVGRMPRCRKCGKLDEASSEIVSHENRDQIAPIIAEAPDEYEASGLGPNEDWSPDFRKRVEEGRVDAFNLGRQWSRSGVDEFVDRFLIPGRNMGKTNAIKNYLAKLKQLDPETLVRQFTRDLEWAAESAEVDEPKETGDK